MYIKNPNLRDPMSMEDWLSSQKGFSHKIRKLLMQLNDLGSEDLEIADNIRESVIRGIESSKLWVVDQPDNIAQDPESISRYTRTLFALFDTCRATGQSSYCLSPVGIHFSCQEPAPNDFDADIKALAKRVDLLVIDGEAHTYSDCPTHDVAQDLYTLKYLLAQRSRAYMKPTILIGSSHKSNAVYKQQLGVDKVISSVPEIFGEKK